MPQTPRITLLMIIFASRAVLGFGPRRLGRFRSFSVATALETVCSTAYHIPERPCHPNLVEDVKKHTFYRDLWKERFVPSEHTLEALGVARSFVAEFHRSIGTLGPEATLPLIIDSGCGTGKSSRMLALANPTIPVLGLDRSFVRLSKKIGPPQGRGSTEERDPKNLLLLRCDLITFWLRAADLVEASEWDVKLHTILYPNPYPKDKLLKSRIHGHPVFPFMLALDADTLVVRASWETYLREFSEAVLAAGESLDPAKGGDKDGRLGAAVWRYRTGATSGPALVPPLPGGGTDSCEAAALTNFELKYIAAGQPVYELRLDGATPRSSSFTPRSTESWFGVRSG